MPWLVVMGACNAQRPEIRTDIPRVEAALERLRAATRPFHSLDAAVAAGYPRTVTECLVHESHGAMGYHHFNRANAIAVPEVERPAILLYERRADGSYQLNGVEFIVPYRLVPRDAEAPIMMGQRMHREDNLNFWYLHVWAWRENREGLFANFHPEVSCLDKGTIYRPYERTGSFGGS
ncbi:MAG: hypothetical protein IPK85_25985 [Gemmatimonadetes bacterium]|nr:hypothetical protein [Gemmatimonadota bacterium]